MTQLILLVVAAAWLAVLIPPMLRSRVENRPNSSVHDFRRQLNKLQSTATPPRGAVRAMGRPLAPSPLQRPAAAGRPGQPTLRSGVRRHDETHIARHAAVVADPHDPHAAGRYRSHGDHTGGSPRDHRHHGGHTAMRVHRDVSRPTTRPTDPRTVARRRRSNVLFLLVIGTACTLFLAATTSSTVMLYLFALSFLALCGYVYLLAQLRQREQVGSYDGWFEQHCASRGEESSHG